MFLNERMYMSDVFYIIIYVCCNTMLFDSFWRVSSMQIRYLYVFYHLPIYRKKMSKMS